MNGQKCAIGGRSKYKQTFREVHPNFRQYKRPAESRIQWIVKVVDHTNSEY